MSVDTALNKKAYNDEIIGVWGGGEAEGRNLLTAERDRGK